MYYGMYRVAKYHPEITTRLERGHSTSQRAWGTAMAMWSYGGGQATHVGLMNEVGHPGHHRRVEAEGMTSQAASLRTNWEQKVNYYVDRQGGFVRVGICIRLDRLRVPGSLRQIRRCNTPGSSRAMGSTNVPLFLQQVQQYAADPDHRQHL